MKDIPWIEAPPETSRVNSLPSTIRMPSSTYRETSSSKQHSPARALHEISYKSIGWISTCITFWQAQASNIISDHYWNTTSNEPVPYIMMQSFSSSWHFEAHEPSLNQDPKESLPLSVPVNEDTLSTSYSVLTYISTTLTSWTVYESFQNCQGRKTLLSKHETPAKGLDSSIFKFLPGFTTRKADSKRYVRGTHWHSSHEHKRLNDTVFDLNPCWSQLRAYDGKQYNILNPRGRSRL